MNWIPDNSRLSPTENVKFEHVQNNCPIHARHDADSTVLSCLGHYSTQGGQVVCTPLTSSAIKFCFELRVALSSLSCILASLNHLLMELQLVITWRSGLYRVAQKVAYFQHTISLKQFAHKNCDRVFILRNSGNILVKTASFYLASFQSCGDLNLCNFLGHPVLFCDKRVLLIRVCSVRSINFMLLTSYRRLYDDHAVTS